MSDLPPPDVPKDKQKKPRHRHSPAQLAALNELFDQNEHPALDLRSSLAERLGMETKTVNAWFQNKRASSKKRSRGVSNNAAPINSSITASTSISTIRHPSESDDYHDDDYSPIDKYASRATSIVPSDHFTPHSFDSGNPDHFHFPSESDSMPRRMRMRPSAEQTEELRKLYNITPHPTTDQRQHLAERIGMRYQSITNWFQNQRSLAKKRKEDDVDGGPSSTSSSNEHFSESRTYSAFPPPSNHPSLGLPLPHTGHSSAPVSRARRSPSVAASLDGRSSRRSSSRHSATPYSTSMTPYSRPRRSRPEPYQLDALKELFSKNPTPSIEERSALALEIGMDVGKVTNWFRNLRQTARKRDKRSGSVDEDDDYSYNAHPYSTSASRSGTPSFRSYSSSSSMELDGDDYDMHEAHSDVVSDEEFQEAVTPPPESIPALPAPTSAPASSSSRIAISELTLSIDPGLYAELEKVSATQYSGIKIEDALLLLSFHQTIVH
ncbi:putative homeobox KN domain containing protein [Lyophyllum shimeji]|uniref:Homeobox KN domain containing protein n=1 Tax=Lyophyllum shimeji TaxID=47721 RepID=A0A9P3PHW1_LYOSH|nr:putative homeobox KN domain containing protein [Lyophyllum shimeji]